MSSDSAAPSPAAAQSGDGQSKTTSNASQADVIAHFIKRENDRSAAIQTADAKATEAQAPAESSADESPSAAEPVQPSSPEATPEAETETPETQEVTETESPAKPEGEADDVLSPESQSLDQKLREKIQKRIDKEVGKRKALEAQLEQVKQQLGNLSQQQQQPQPQIQPVAPPVNAPLPDIKDHNALSEYARQAEETVLWADEVLDKDNLDQGVQVGDKIYTKDEIKTIRRNANRALRVQIPAQVKYFSELGQAEAARQRIWQAASTKFPVLTQKEAPEVNQAVAFLNQSIPGFMQSPAASWVAGAYIEGIKALMAKEQAGNATPAKTAPAATPKVKPKPPGDQTMVTTTASTPRMSPDAASLAAIKAPTGNQTAATTAAWLAQMERLKMARR